MVIVCGFVFPDRVVLNIGFNMNCVQYPFQPVRTVSFAIILLFVVSFPINAAVTPDEASRLRQDLTPLGAKRAGNADGSIPPWRVRSMDKLSLSLWLNKIEKEDPLFIINYKNYHQYREFLSAGLIALLEKYPDTFRIPVYPTHRTAILENWLYDNTYENALHAELSESSEEIKNAIAGIPFPIPSSPKEVIWNHQLRWKGLFIEMNTIGAVVLRNGQYSLIHNTQEIYSAYHNRNIPEKDDFFHTYFLSYINAPTRLAGGAFLSYEPLQPSYRPRQVWIYIAGQRRMRRSATVWYDSPSTNSDGLRMADEVDMFNGPKDRYDWVLIGKKEMYVPYNSLKIKNELSRENLLLTINHINHEYTRYEKHRVWIVEAKLKKNKSHVYKRRVFYIDEDSWNILLVDLYDNENRLWRVSQRYTYRFSIFPVTAPAIDSFNDLKRETYFIQGYPPDGIKHSDSPPPKGYFSPTHVRQRLHR